jgi:hypothetical protein
LWVSFAAKCVFHWAAPNWPNIAALLVWLLSVGALLIGAVRGRKARPEPPAA